MQLHKWFVGLAVIVGVCVGAEPIQAASIVFDFEEFPIVKGEQNVLASRPGVVLSGQAFQGGGFTISNQAGGPPGGSGNFAIVSGDSDLQIRSSQRITELTLEFTARLDLGTIVAVYDSEDTPIGLATDFRERPEVTVDGYAYSVSVLQDGDRFNNSGTLTARATGLGSTSLFLRIDRGLLSVDNLRITVPEPNSALLAGVIACGLVVRRRRGLSSR